MVEQLQQLSIDATLISDAAVFPLMSRIHRVLLGSQSGGFVFVRSAVAVILFERELTIELSGTTNSDSRWWCDC